MWFKQIQIFQLANSFTYDAAKLSAQLEPLSFTPCLPSFFASHGWVPPLDEDDAPLVHALNGNMMICLQIEEKILPAVVIKQELVKKIKEIETERGRKVLQKEKYALKEEIIQTLLPRAFSKFSRVHAYIDTKNNWLVVDTTHAARIDKFLDLLKKSISNTDVQAFKIEKLSPILTRWLIKNDYPNTFAVEKSCVLRDPNKQSRIIRCQQQDLSANAIQLIIKDGCEIIQLALTWHDHVQFVLADDLSLRSIKFNDEITTQAMEMEAETARQRFETDFYIMTETLAKLLNDLLPLFIKPIDMPMTNSKLVEYQAA